jgi:hypothetical protein
MHTSARVGENPIIDTAPESPYSRRVADVLRTDLWRCLFRRIRASEGGMDVEASSSGEKGDEVNAWAM